MDHPGRDQTLKAASAGALVVSRSAPAGAGTISLDKESYTVVGVMAKSFHSIPDAQLWIPFQFDLNSTNQLHSFVVAARLKPGVTLDQANAQLAAASDSAKHASELPDPDFRFQLRRLHDAWLAIFDLHS